MKRKIPGQLSEKKNPRSKMEMEKALFEQDLKITLYTSEEVMGVGEWIKFKGEKERLLTGFDSLEFLEGKS